MSRLALVPLGRAFVFWVCVALLLGCAGRSTETIAYKLYPGPLRTPSEIAIVRLGDAYTLEIDGRPVSQVDWTEVHVLPGTHVLRWQTEFLVSAMIEPTGFATGGREAVVALEAGHVYVVRADRTTGAGYRMFFWIEEADSGRVVAGKAKP